MGRTVYILMPRVGILPALGKMLSEVFDSLGWQVTLRFHPDAGLLDHDLLLLACLSRHDGGLTELLRQRKGHRPVTVLWQLEPLPPVPLSPLGEAVGFRVAACDWGRLPSWARRVLAWVVPFRPKLLRLARRWLARPYARQVIHSPDEEGWKAFEVGTYFKALAEWRRIREVHASGGVDHYFATNQPRVAFLRSRGIEATLLPFGYHPDWGRNLQLQRDIDVLFLGRWDRGRRKTALGELEEQLARRGRTLTVVRGAFGPEREKLLNRARIFVNLLRAPHDMAGMRLLLGMACGALVVSEHCDGTGEFRAGEHFVMAERSQLAGVIDHYLAHEAERSKIARQGNEFVTQELTLANVVREMLKQVVPHP